MKIITAYSKDNLDELSKLDETIVVYTNDKRIYDKIVKIRKNMTTHIIYDEAVKTVQEVMFDYSEQFTANGVINPEVYRLTERCSYVPYTIAIVMIVLLLILIVSFFLYSRK